MSKQHFIGATYELTQENMNGLIEQLESANAENARLSEANTKLRAALEFYTVAINYTHRAANEPDTPIRMDKGKIAREALEK